MQIFRNNERGTTDASWLKSRHSFSFGNFYRDDRNGFSVLRALNEDELAPETGFPTQSLRDIEILSYVLAGELAYKDSEGNVVRLPAGGFQLISAGSGIRHTESNPLAARKLRLMQIWIAPSQLGQAPRYQQQRFAQAPGFTLVASPDGAANSLQLQQDAWLNRLVLAADEVANLSLTTNRHVYVQLLNGRLQLDAGGEPVALDAGDGVGLAQISELRFSALEGGVEALVFDLP